MQNKNSTELMKFFTDKIGNLDKQTQADIASGKKEFQLADFYIRKLLGGTGIQNILLETDSRAAGVTNIDKAKLYKGQDLLLTSIGLAYGYHASAETVDTVDYSSNIYKINDVVADDVLITAGVPVRYIPIGIVNSEFSLLAGGSLVYKSRTRKFLSEATSGYAAEANDENCVMLQIPKLVRAETKLTMQLEFGANAAALVNKNFVEVRLQGLYLADR